MRAAAALLLTGLVAAGCSEPTSPGSDPAPRASTSPTPSETATVAPPPSASPTQQAPAPAVRPAAFDVGSARAVVEFLAGEIGPRHGTSPEFRRAVTWTSGYFRRLGYDVAQRDFPVPAGDSWGVPVAAGRSTNVVATPEGFDPTRPHLVIGAHLDTVAPSPGAEDNASGVGVMLAAAAAAADARTRLPVVWIAFGAEEPRGEGDDDHHYGSRAYVAQLTPAERRAMRAMISLDRVGVGATVPVGSANESDPVQQQLLEAAEAAGVAAFADPGSRSSDHWSFVRDGLPAARLGSTSYAAYHSSSDLPPVVQPAQLERTGRIVLTWLAPTRP